MNMVRLKLSWMRLNWHEKEDGGSYYLKFKARENEKYRK